MKISNSNWTINKLERSYSSIDPKPQYQRTSVWQPNKKKLLIDSILRGYDLPKFYLREIPQNKMYDYEVTDGQQRIRAILEFINGGFKLDENIFEDNYNTKGLDYKQLKESTKYYTRFKNFKLTIAVIKEASQEEIRTLFARLQMGERLNPVELRHALSSNIGNLIYSITENHSFFNKDCKIINSRYKHQDYLDNAITLSYYDAVRNIKATDMRHLYLEFSNSTLQAMQPLLKKVNATLSMMERVNNYKKGIFKNKWAFVDIFYLIFKNITTIRDIKPKNFSDNFYTFEVDRKKYNSNPEQLIDDKASMEYDKDMYDYIIAFKTSGSDKNNAKIRYRVLFNKLYNKTNFDVK